MSYWNQFLWVIFPFLMIAISIIGHIYRYRTDQAGWTSRSSEFLEKKSLRWGSILFHYGIVLVFFGHFGGIMVPKELLLQVGVTDEFYHLNAVYGGGIAGTITTIGLGLLLVRRFSDRRIVATSSLNDKLIVVFLALVILLGMYNTVIYNMFYGGFDYRTTISPWFRSLFYFAPDANLMTDVPLSFQLHIIFAFMAVGLWPFTRLVHVWSLPVLYLRRAHVLYRRMGVR